MTTIIKPMSIEKVEKLYVAWEKKDYLCASVAKQLADTMRENEEIHETLKTLVELIERETDGFGFAWEWEKAKNLVQSSKHRGVECKRCFGTRKDPIYKDRRCQDCGGTGRSSKT